MFLLGINKYWDNTIHTACVKRNGINVELAINKDYWEKIGDDYALNMLVHEVNHIVHKHLWMMEDFENKKRFNVASDLMVNQYLEKVHPDWLDIKQFGFQENMGTRWYYENLPEHTEDNFDSFDDHSWEDFENMSSAEKQLVDNQIDYISKNAAEEIMKAHGDLPGHLKEYFDNLFQKRKCVFNWKAYFKRVVGNSIKSYIKTTRYKPSRRFKGQAGNILKFNPKILVAIDTSGSISKEELTEFFSELEYLYKTGIYIEVVEFDTRIQKQFIYRGQKMDIEIVGRGGTDMSDVYTMYTQHSEFSTLVVFTDGYLNVDYPRHRNMIFVISSNGMKQGYPGTVVYIPKQK